MKRYSTLDDSIVVELGKFVRQCSECGALVLIGDSERAHDEFHDERGKIGGTTFLPTGADTSFGVPRCSVVGRGIRCCLPDGHIGPCQFSEST